MKKLRPARLPEKLRQVRVALALSQSGMVRQLGVEDRIDRSSVSSYEAGKREPPLIVLSEYARVANIHLDVLIDDEVNLPDILPSAEVSEGVRQHRAAKAKTRARPKTVVRPPAVRTKEPLRPGRQAATRRPNLKGASETGSKDKRKENSIMGYYDDSDETIYKVVVNDEEQYSIWPAERENALGWNDAGKMGNKQECLAYIEEVWTDMRPLSLRKRMAETSSSYVIAEPATASPLSPFAFAYRISCPSCGKPNAPDRQMCLTCGHLFQSSPDDRITCSGCGKSNAPDRQLCLTCGHLFRLLPADASTQEQTSAWQPTPGYDHLPGGYMEETPVKSDSWRTSSETAWGRGQRIETGAMLGEVRLFAGHYAPEGWAMCRGQYLPIVQNVELFMLFGTTYGGNGQTTFALPDLRGRSPMHMGNGYELGQTGSVGFTDRIPNEERDMTKGARESRAAGFLAMNYIISLEGTSPNAGYSEYNDQPLLAEGRIFPFPSPPDGWASCNGQIMSISENTVLFCLLGTAYGGNGQTTFALPDLQGLIPMHRDENYSLGSPAGEEDAVFDVNVKEASINFLALNFCIAWKGRFPERF
jgi:microcystin-dependent protein/uncharacterized protein YbdZ (MbtH family)/transcriptional regulator with XRE-family HTH domain